MPTFFEPSIQRMRVEAFRGFRDPRSFDLDASAVIVTGPNGTGKTSFFDALQWCLLGSVQRLEDLRARKTVEHLVNQYRLQDRAVVELDLKVGGQSFTIRRTGDHLGSTLELTSIGAEPFFGDEAQSALEERLVASGEMSLDLALTTSGLMQQDVMRSVLQAKPADRYRHLSTVLGLAGLEDFEEAARGLAKDAKERFEAARKERDLASGSVQVARERLSLAEERLKALPQLESLREEILRLPERRELVGRIQISEEDLLTPSGAKFLSTGLGVAIDRLEAFLRASQNHAAVPAPSEAMPSPETLAAMESELAQRNDDVASANQEVLIAQARIESASAAGEELATLAAIVIPMLGEHCPVCGQSIDPTHVEQELRSRAQNTDAIVALRSGLEFAQASLLEAQGAVMAAKDLLTAMHGLTTEWQQHLAGERLVSEAFGTLQECAPLLIVQSGTPFALASNGDDLLDEMRAKRTRVLELLNALERGPDQGALQRSSSEVSSLEELLRAREKRVEDESQRAVQMKNLSDSAIRARVQVTQQRFAAVQPLVANIFSRLDPHPAFKTIEFELDTYYRKGTTSPMVRDLVAGIAADPLVIFSTSQANIAALSYFLAMGISAGAKGLPFVLLDDPVQSMDDVNVLGFADLCRHLRKDRQLIISTHDRRFARLLERKLAPRFEGETTTLVEFVGWDRSGPTLAQRDLAPQLIDSPIRVVKLAS